MKNLKSSLVPKPEHERYSYNVKNPPSGFKPKEPIHACLLYFQVMFPKVYTVVEAIRCTHHQPILGYLKKCPCGARSVSPLRCSRPNSALPKANFPHKIEISANVVFKIIACAVNGPWKWAIEKCVMVIVPIIAVKPLKI